MVDIYYRDRQTVDHPIEFNSDLVELLYGRSWGQKLLPIVTQSLFSKLYSLMDYLPMSKRKIDYFVETFHIDLNQYEQQNYKHFADFFTRKLKPTALKLPSSSEVMAVAQAKLQVFTIDKSLTVEIKNQTYQLAELIQDNQLTPKFDGGILCVYRLALEDYHRYLTAESGKILFQKNITGKLHSVRELAQTKAAIFKENKRVVTAIETAHLGIILQMEIGALLVGKINNYKRKQVYKGQEKGWFSLGGSTIVVAYPANTIQIDQDILDCSKLGIETQVQIGERIGSYHD